MESRIEQVEREDVLGFFNAALAGTGQAEFYDTAEAQSFTLDFLHRYMQVNYRQLYARALALVRNRSGLNHHNALRIIANLLAAGAPADLQQRAEENALIRAALRRLPPQRVFKLFQQLSASKVNNRRTRATIRDWLAARRDPVFDLVKYRSRYRTIALHAHLKLGGEEATFLFGKWIKFRAPLLEKVRQARYSKEKVYELPYTIAEGWASFHGIPRAQFLERIQGQMTTNERQLLQRSAAEADVELDVELDRVPLTRLCLYVLSLPVKAREARRTELMAALEGSAARVPGLAELAGPVAAVLDRSWSSSGSSEKRRRPLAVAMGLGLAVQGAGGRLFWTEPVEDLMQVSARGSTRLAEPLLDALESGAATVLILSDGAENDPPGAVAELVRRWRERLDPAGRVRLIHLNPVLSAEELRPLPLSPHIPTIGIRDAEDLPFSLALAAFAEGRPKAELDGFLAHAVRQALPEEA